MNLILLASAACSAALSVNYLKHNNTILPIKVLVSLGLITSILNHGFTNKYFKYLDRLVMVIIVIVYAYLLYDQPELYVLVIGSMSYIMSKTMENSYTKNISHIGAHVCATYLNTFMLLYPILMDERNTCPHALK